MARKSKEIPHLRLRVESPLLARLTKAAEKNERTLTGEIVDRLEASFKRDDMQALIDTTAQRIKEQMVAAVGELGSAADKYKLEAEKRRIIYNEFFELDLKMLSERYPDTPAEEHAKYLRERADRWAKMGDKQ